MMEYDPTVWDILLTVALGLGLSAACGFRIFAPLLVMSVASHGDFLDLASGFEWIGSWPALIALGVATTLEIAAYYVPWVDNLLDLAGTPAAVTAGVLTTASTVTGMDPMLQWSLAVIAGGGAAGVTHGALALVRKTSSLTTFGVANPVLSTVEAGGSILLSVLAIFLPFVALGLLLVAIALAFRVARRLRSNPEVEAAAA